MIAQGRNFLLFFLLPITVSAQDSGPDYSYDGFDFLSSPTMAELSYTLEQSLSVVSRNSEFQFRLVNPDFIYKGDIWPPHNAKIFEFDEIKILDIGTCGPTLLPIGGSVPEISMSSETRLKLNELASFSQAAMILAALELEGFSSDSRGKSFRLDDFAVTDKASTYLPDFDRFKQDVLNERLFDLFEVGLSSVPLVVVSYGGCGAGEVEVELISYPPADEIRVISPFDFELCKLGMDEVDAWSPTRCSYWTPFLGELSGRNLVRARLRDGQEVCSSVTISRTIEGDTMFGEPDTIEITLGFDPCPS